MTTKRSTLLAAAVAAASAAGLATGLDTGQGQAPPGRSMTLQLGDVRPTITDGGPRGRGAGDRFSYAVALRENGASAGRLVATIDATRASGRTALLVGTLDLGRRGSLAVQGPIDFAKTEQGTLAVTGGTGQFEGATGVATVHDRDDRVSLELRLR
jgi:hypothetical protein